MDSMNKHITIQVNGRVQNVWFRQSTKCMAESLNLVGYAKNNDDGTVTIEACSADTKSYSEARKDKEELMELVRWCNDGSKMARVDNVEYVIDDANCNYEDFKIL
jgi:acylphosphatase